MRDLKIVLHSGMITGYTELKELNATDRDNLADILWWIKGMRHAGNITFCEEHEESLERVICAIRNKINDEINEQKRTGS